MGRILAIDYGQKRTGLAVTDEQRIIAGALGTVESVKLLEYLARYTLENKVDLFVVGQPRQMNNEPSESSRFIDPFIRSLKKRFPAIPLEQVDERFTSKMASRVILESGIGKMARRDKSLIDTVSATIILQSYLEKLSYQ